MPSTSEKVIVLVGPSGGGKTSIARKLLAEFPNFTFSVSATTRPPRNEEKDGTHYHFLSNNEFQSRIDSQQFVEWEEFYGGNRYGTLKSDIENKLKNGYIVLFDVEVNGAKSIKQAYEKQALTIFLRPPSLSVLKERLILRGTENEKTLQQRLERAEMEMQQAPFFDVVITNHILEDTYNEVKSKITQFLNS